MPVESLWKTRCALWSTRLVLWVREHTSRMSPDNPPYPLSGLVASRRHLSPRAARFAADRLKCRSTGGAAHWKIAGDGRAVGTSRRSGAEHCSGSPQRGPRNSYSRGPRAYVVTPPRFWAQACRKCFPCGQVCEDLPMRSRRFGDEALLLECGDSDAV